LVHFCESKRTGWVEPSTTKSEVKKTDAIFDKPHNSGDGSGAVVRLHQNRAKTIGALIGFEEGELGAVVAGKARAGGDIKLDLAEDQA
jgi:hypothetical protein